MVVSHPNLGVGEPFALSPNAGFSIKNLSFFCQSERGINGFILTQLLSIVLAALEKAWSPASPPNPIVSCSFWEVADLVAIAHYLLCNSVDSPVNTKNTLYDAPLASRKRNTRISNVASFMVQQHCQRVRPG